MEIEGGNRGGVEGSRMPLASAVFLPDGCGRVPAVSDLGVIKSHSSLGSLLANHNEDYFCESNDAWLD